jgi:hypothetical protein
MSREIEIAESAICAVHLTFLKPDGSSKADVDPAKITIGSPTGAPLVLAPMNDLLGLAITEGIEDAISVHQEADLGAWAAGSWSFMPALSHTVPDFTRIASPSLQMTMRMACVELVSWHAGSATVGSTSS